MNHPSFKLIQDYFEGELQDNKNVTQIKKHLEGCDRCSLVLSEMAKIDVLFLKKEVEIPHERVKEELLKQGFELLKERRAKIKAKQTKKDYIATMVRDLNELKRQALSELTVPVIQAGAICLLLTTFVSITRDQSYIEEYEIIPEDVQVFTKEKRGEKE